MVDSLRAEVTAICNVAQEESRDLNAEETARIDAINGTPDRVGELAEATVAMNRQVKIEAQIQANLASQRPNLGVARDADEDVLNRIRVPLKYRNRHNPKVFSSDREAYACGQWFLATVGNNQPAQSWCREHGITNAMTESSNTAGGYLVPEQFESSLIRLVEDYGVFRRNGYVYPMASDAVTIPRRNGGYTVYYVGENTAPTASDLAFNQVRLSAKKPAILTQISSELMEDEVVGLANLMAQEFALALATAEDQAGFNGDGTSTYGGILGIKNTIGSAGVADAASGNTAFSTLDLADFHNTKAKLPAYAGAMNKWYISSQGYAASMELLQLAAGGNSMIDIANGGVPMFLGSPVVFTQVLPTTTAAQTSTIVAYYGDLGMATTMGVRRGMQIASDRSYYFTSDSIAVRCTERYDIVCHSVGDSTNAGAIVALKTAAS